MGTTRAVTGRGWGQNAAKGVGTGWGRGQEYILRGGNGVKHLSPCHSLVPTFIQASSGALGKFLLDALHVTTSGTRI